MGFFDNVSRQVSSYSQKAVQKTRDVSDSVKISSQISEEERKINNYYAQLGKEYYSLHADSNEAEFAEIINTIKASEAKIAGLRKQIQNIKGVLVCGNCGGEITKGASFCSICGASVPKEEPAPLAVRCGNCGAVVKGGNRFCTSCGSPLNPVNEAAASEPEQASVSGPVSLSEPEEKSASPAEAGCPSCGKRLKEGSSFCTECGTKIGG